MPSSANTQSTLSVSPGLKSADLHQVAASWMNHRSLSHSFNVRAPSAAPLTHPSTITVPFSPQSAKQAANTTRKHAREMLAG